MDDSLIKSFFGGQLDEETVLQKLDHKEEGIFTGIAKRRIQERSKLRLTKVK